MKYSFVIDVAEDVSYDYVRTAIVSCKEFLSLFPEYKDRFGIEVRYKNKLTNVLTGKSIDFDGTISKEQFESSFPNGNDKYIRLPNGRYLVPGESMAWYEAFSKRENGGFNYSKASVEQVKWKNSHLNANTPTNYFRIGITNKKMYNEEGLFGYGISTPQVGTVVSTSCFTQNKFKRLILHEFSHVFEATPDERSNITDTQYGVHCATKGCIARDVAFAPLEAANKPKLFCDQCIESMRAYLGKVIKNERTPNNQTNVVDSSQELPPNTEANDEFKQPWRTFAKNIAQKMKWQYEEDEKDINFRAKLKTEDGACTFVNASSKNNVSLSAKDKNGKSKIPDMVVFKELVAKAKKDNKTISFGNIKSPEFKARLLAAAMTSNPPVKTIGAPELNDEFLNSIENQTAMLLKTLQNKQQFRNNDTEEENPENKNLKPYEKTKNERKRVLEAKAKTKNISPMEQTELNYIYFLNERKEALESARKRTGSNEDSRSVEHVKTTGLPKEDYRFNDKKNREFSGWKLHLDVVPNRNHPTTKAVSEFLERLEVSHKIASGGDNGKGMTIYVGGYDDAVCLAEEINSRFGKNIAEPPLYTDQKGEETDINKITTGRFYLQDIFQTQYPRSSIKGLCPADYGSLSDANMENIVVALAKKEGLIDSNYVRQHVSNTDFHDHYIVTNIESYCAHKFYQKHLGEFYCGQDVEKFEKEIFGDAIPPKGSKEREKWDDIATRYANVLETENPRCIESMKAIKQNYTPIDFSKAPVRVSFNQRPSGRVS